MGVIFKLTAKFRQACPIASFFTPYHPMPHPPHDTLLPSCAPTSPIHARNLAKSILPFARLCVSVAGSSSSAAASAASSGSDGSGMVVGSSGLGPRLAKEEGKAGGGGGGGGGGGALSGVRSGVSMAHSGPSMLGEDEDDVFNPHYLRSYYARLFPYHTMYRWLSYGQDPSSESSVVAKDFFSRREFSFTIAAPGRDEIYIRYLSFRDEAEMKAAIQARQPHKIDIGAVFTASPAKHTTMKKDAFRTVERELVFDIDLTDYDEIRFCCSGAAICRRCWPYMTAAIEVLDRALLEDFGFKHRLWVYSGRRGVHCWVSDKQARALQDHGRAAVAEYLQVVAGGGEHTAKRRTVHIGPSTPPSIKRATDQLDRIFREYILPDEGQGLLGSEHPERWEKVLEFLPDGEFSFVNKDNLRKHWAKEGHTPESRWDAFNKALEDEAKEVEKRGGDRRLPVELRRTPDLIILAFTYPRLDINVSKGTNHLLKSPFCVHPKTGRVCVPIDPTKAHDFNPLEVPTVADLCKEYAARAKDDPPPPGLTGTTMDTFVATMQKTFLAGLEESVARSMRAQERAQRELAAAATGDW